MALGGGRFATMNKVLPGTYINVITQTADSHSIESGVVALPYCLNWGPKSSIIEVLATESATDIITKLGDNMYTAENLLPIREIFKGGATKVIIYNLNDGEKAACTFATAKHEGTRGNDIKIKISANVDDPSKKDVATIIDGAVKGLQTVAKADELIDNDWVVFNKTATLEVTAGTPLTGGSNGTITGTQHMAALEALEQKFFNVLICDATEKATVALYAAYVKRMRDALGKGFQLVAYSAAEDYEGVINVATRVDTTGGAKESALVYWVAGKSVSRAFGKSNTNATYNGELAPLCTETQAQLEEAIKNGKLIFHTVGDDFKVLLDINSLTTFTDEKGSLMAKNEVVRVTDYLNNSIASLFNSRYIGNVINSDAGRAHLRQDIASIQDELVNAGAINYNGNDLKVSLGPDKGDVVIEDLITINAAMVRLYMTVRVN